METSGWIQFAIYLIALALVTKPMGLYLMHVLDPNGRTWLDPVLAPVERFTYRAMGVDARKEHDWKQYTLAMLLFSLVGCLFTYAILRLQYFLPLNPQKLAGVSPDLSFNTATSFTTNTNWQNYGGESTMSYSRRWSGWRFTISSRPPPGSPSRLRSLGQLRGIRQQHSAISGSTWFGSLTTCCCRSVWCLQSSWCRKE